MNYIRWVLGLLLIQYFLDRTLMHCDIDASEALILHHFNKFLEDPSKIYLSQFEIKMVWVEKYRFFHVWSHPNFYMKIQTISGLISWKKSGFGLMSGKTNQIEALIMKLDFLAIWIFYDFPKEVPKIFFFLEISILCGKNSQKRP